MNTNWSDEVRVLDRIAPSRDLWEDALARAASPRPRVDRGVRGLPWVRSWGRRSVVLAGVVVLAAIGTASAVAYHYLGPSPGLSAGLSSLDNLPPTPWPSSLPRTALDNAAAATGLTPKQAARRLRLVQTGLSLGQESADDVSLYAFQGKAGTGCLFITGPDSGGICLPSWMTKNPALDGLAYADGGGSSPRTPGPVAVYGLVADNVSEVDTEISGVAHNVPIVNNSFYADYDRLTSADAITLIVHFDDGTTRTFHLPNPYAG